MGENKVEGISEKAVNWWSSRDADKAKKKSQSRNDRVADLWTNRGWGDDDDLWDDDDTFGLGQERTVRRVGRRNVVAPVTPVGINVADKAVTALNMVQSFVDAFSTTSYGYRVVFDPSVPTAATAFETKTIILTPGPIFDKTLTGAQCGLILTGMAVHEVSHVRYDQETREAVKRAWTKDAKVLALRISNILSDHRIERNFSRDWPGYSDVFEPTLEYVSRPFHGAKVSFDANDPGNFVVASIRYSQWLDWSVEWATEAAWWQALADKAALNDEPAYHVKCVREGMNRIDMLKAKYPAAIQPHAFVA